MQPAERSVLHVLPHPGGGGETYVDLLAAMDGYRFRRVYLAADPTTPPVRQLPRGVLETALLARDHDLLHLHGEAAGALCRPLLGWRPSVVTFHGLHLVRRLAGPKRAAAAQNVRAVIQAAGQTICVSQAEHDALEAVAGAAAGRAAVIHNGVELPRLPSPERGAVRAELGLEDAGQVGIWVGSLDPHKDPLTAIRAAREASIPLLLVGNGPLRQEVERAAGESIHVLGHRDDVPRLLAAADFYVLTSHREGFSLSLLEAMAQALPPVVSGIAENLEAVGPAGLAVPIGDDAAFANAFRRLVDSPEERASLGEQARQRVAENFSAGRMIEETAGVYTQLVGQRRPRARPTVGPAIPDPMSGRAAPRERTVLHVLPHPGGGGETYVDVLSAMPDYRFSRLYLGSRPRPASWDVARGTTQALRRAAACDVLHVHGEIPAVLLLPSLASKASVITLHGLNLLRRLDGRGRDAAELNLRLLLRAATRTICVSESEYEDLASAVGEAASSRAVVIPNGIEPPAVPGKRARASIRAQLGIDGGAVVGILVGDLAEPKEPLAPVRAALRSARAGLPLTLLVVGNGPLRPLVEGAAEELHGEAVRILGFRHDVPELLSAADFFVLSSHREGLSYSLLEGMSFSLPAVVTNVPGNLELLGDAGIAVDVGDVEAFAAAYEQFVLHPGRRRALGRKARERVQSHFSGRRMIEDTRRVYEQVLSERQGVGGRPRAASAR